MFLLDLHTLQASLGHEQMRDEQNTTKPSQENNN